MHETLKCAPVLKAVGRSGQISLGKAFAGQQVQVEMREAGVWIIRTVAVVPTNELWLHSPEVSAALNRAAIWATANPLKKPE
jgi:hypothetical protein